MRIHQHTITLVGFFLIIFLLPNSVETPKHMHYIGDLSVEHLLADFMGEKPMTGPGVANWDFEEADSNGIPSDWNYNLDGFARVNMSDTGQVHSGTYSANILSEPSPAYDYIYFSHQPSGDDIFIQPNMNYSAWVYPESLSPSADAYIYVGLENSTGYEFYLYYFLDGSSWGSSNISYSEYSYTYFDLSPTISAGQWNQVKRNFTQDVVETHTTFDPETYYVLTSCQISISSSSGIQANYYFDDFSLNNGTEWFEKGNFESSPETNWFCSAPKDRSYLTLGSLSTHGLYSANLTAMSTIDSAYSEVQVYYSQWSTYQRQYVTNDSKPVIEFDWYMDFEGLSNNFNQRTFFQIQLDDLMTGQDYYLYYLLGSGAAGSWGSNTTYSKYFISPNFNKTGVWDHLSLNLYSTLSSFGWGNLSILYYGFSVSANYKAGARMTLLVDDFSLNIYPTVDPGFEIHTSTDEFDAWYQSDYGTPFVNRTLDSHSGLYAANLTSVSDDYNYLRRWMYLDVSQSLTTDFFWRLDRMSGDSGGNNVESYIEIQFDNWQSLYYYLSSYSPPVSNWNDTWNLYYNVDEINNVSSSWHHLTRNIYDDSQAFEVAPKYIRQITFHLISSGSGEISILFDDIHFVQDTHSPVISSVSRVTPTPNYYTTVDIQADVSDIELDTVLVMYRYNSGTWNELIAIYTGTYYEVQIPEAAYGTLIEFYVWANDTMGQSSINDNSGVYYSYQISDDVSPIIDSIRPLTGTTVEEIVTIEFDVSDPDAGSSGVSHVELWNGAALLMNDSSAPWGFEWNSRTVANGTYNLGLKVFDNAGNSAMGNVTLTVNNDVSGPVLSEVIVNPENPRYGENVIISVAVVDYTAVENVTLYTKVNGEAWSSILMNVAGVLYSTELPAYDWGTEVSFYIVAYDTFGVSSMLGNELDPMSYVVIDDIAPVMSVTGPTTFETLSGIVQFIISGIDAGSGILDYRVHVDGVSIETVSVGAGSINNDLFLWDTTTLENGNPTITFTVTDRAGNTVLLEIEYAIFNPQGIEVIGSELEEIMTKYGFFVGAATVLILIVAVRILLRRRGS